MKKKVHLSREQNYQISVLLQTGHSQKEIAELLKKNKSVISQELKHNRGKYGYHPALAYEMTEEREERFKRHRRFTEKLRLQVEKELREYQYSPVQIVSQAHQEDHPMICITSIHKNKATDGNLYKHLRHQSSTGNIRRKDISASRIGYR